MEANKQIFYKIFKFPEEIDENAIVKLLNEAVRVDRLFSGKYLPDNSPTGFN